jgi:hypothetical protein
MRSNPRTDLLYEVLRLFVRRKKSLLAGVFGIALTSLWKGGFHEYSTRSTGEPAEIPA